jgi:hypothetical protein
VAFHTVKVAGGVLVFGLGSGDLGCVNLGEDPTIAKGECKVPRMSTAN